MEQTLQVKVDLVPLDWIVSLKGSHGHKLQNLIPILQSIDDEELYTTPFVEALKFSAITLRKQAVNYCFVPFVVQVAVSSAYFSIYTFDDPFSEERNHTLIQRIIEAIVTITTLWFLFIECLELSAEKLHHFSSLTTFIDFTSIMTNLLIVVNEILERSLIDPELKPYIVAYAVFSLWFRAFYWMRVFGRPAFFILLIKRTLYGILPFMMLVVIILLLFANVLYIFDLAQNAINPWEEATIYEDELGNDFYNAVMHTYLMSLDAFKTSGYGQVEGAKKQILWIHFVACTFIFHLTFMNMLIGIMGNIFAQTMKKEEQSKMTERLQLLQDLKGVFKFFDKNLRARYLLVIKPKSAQEEASLGSRVDAMKSYMELQHKKTKEELRQDFKEQISEIKETKIILQEKLEDTQNEVRELKEQQTKQIGELKDLITKMLKEKSGDKGEAAFEVLEEPQYL